METKPNALIHIEQGETLPGYEKNSPVPDKYIYEFTTLIERMNAQRGTVFLKLKQLYAFLNRFDKHFVSDFVACKKGCSHCCKMDMQLTWLEAEYIWREAGIPALNNPLTTGHTSACPFLSEKKSMQYL